MKLNNLIEIEKKALVTPVKQLANPTLAQGFMTSAKQSIPWSLGFFGLNALTSKPEEEKATIKNLSKHLLSGAAGWGSFDLAKKVIGSKLKPTPESIMKLPFLKRLTKLPYLKNKILPYAAGMYASGLAYDLINKILPEKEQVDPQTEILLNYYKQAGLI